MIDKLFQLLKIERKHPDAYLIGYRLIVLRTKGKYGLNPEGICPYKQSWKHAYEQGKADARTDLGLPADYQATSPSWLA